MVKLRYLNLILLVFVSLFMVSGCGKKDGSTSDNKSDNKTDSKSDFSPDKPFHVVFAISGTKTGTVDAIYAGKKARTESSMNMENMTVTATAYFNGGDTVYMVSEVGGMKTGMKFAKSEFAKNKDQMDMYTFKDKLKEMDKIGTEEIIGKKCDIYRAKDSSYTFSVYNETVPLKFSSRSGKMVMVATKYDTDVKISDEMFIPPKDIKFTDAGGMMKDMEKMKDPKNMQDMKDKMKEMEDVMKNYKK